MKKRLLFSLFLFLFIIKGNSQILSEIPGSEPIVSEDTVEILTLRQARQMEINKPEVATRIANATGDGMNVMLRGFTDGAGLLNFTSSAPTTSRTVEYATDVYLLAGAEAPDKYYLIEYEIVGTSTIKPIYLIGFDLSTKTFTRLVKLAEDFPIIMDMTFNRKDGKMYAISGSQSDGSSALCSFDLQSGLLTTLRQFDQRYYGIAADNQGVLFMIGVDGTLVRVTDNNYELKTVGNTGLKPYYIESMDFNLANRTLYWALCDKNGTTSLVSVNPNTAQSSVLGTIGRGSNNTEIIALSVQSVLPSASAPAAVTDFIYTAGAQGALSLNVSWKNPRLTYGGEALQAIDRIEVYCNGILQSTLISQKPGETASAEISGLKTGLTTVKVVAVNEAGAGDFREEVRWIGVDVPGVVTDITLERRNASQAILTWKKPITGANEGWFDTTTLKYRITRFSQTGDSVVVAKAYSKNTEFVDETINSTNRYYYRIQSLGRDYGLINHSDVRLLGPAVKTPFICFFNTDSIANLWTMYDNNGDGTTWTVSTYGKYIYHLGKSVASDDWAVTPPVELKKDSVYYLYFEYRTGLGEFYPKKLEVTLGNSADYSSHKVISTLEFASRITEQARITIPIDATGEYYIGLHDVSNYCSANLRVTAFYLDTKHTGKIKGVVKDKDGIPLESVKVEIPNSTISDYTDASGNYILDYLPNGVFSVGATLYGYQDVISDANIKVTVDSVTDYSFVMNPLGIYKLSGSVSDTEGQAIRNAWITVSGYGEKQTVMSDANGNFEIGGLFGKKYQWVIEKFKHLSQKDSIVLDADKSLQIVLEPKILIPSDASATSDGNKVIVSWNHPRDIFRHDNGLFESQTGWLGGNENTLHGAVYEKPAVLKSISWVTTSYKGPHNEMNLWIMDITPEGKPTAKVLFNAMRVPSKGDEVWNKYELSEPVEAPNGYFLAVSYNFGMSSLAMDSGEDSEYPFVPYINYKSLDYTTDVWTCLDASFLTRNFLIRAEGDEIGDNPQIFNYKYKIWRFNEEDAFDESKWVLLTESPITDTRIVDTEINSLPNGNYFYALAAIYPDNRKSDYVYTDNVSLSDGSGVSMVSAEEVLLFPNPVAETLWFSRICPQIEVFDLSGTLKLSTTDADYIDMRSLVDGSYIVKITIDHRIIMRKVIVKK